MMLDLLASTALSVACGAAAFVQPVKVNHSASHKLAPPKLTLRNNGGIFMVSSFSAPWRFSLLSPCRRASWDYRNAKIKWIDGNRHRVACAIIQHLGGEVRRALIGHALREIRKVRRVVCAKNASKFAAHGKQIIVVPQVGEELLRRHIRRDRRQHEVPRRHESIVRLHYMCNPSPVAKLLVKKSHHTIIRNGQRTIRSVMDRRTRQIRLRPSGAAVR